VNVPGGGLEVVVLEGVEVGVVEPDVVVELWCLCLVEVVLAVRLDAVVGAVIPAVIGAVALDPSVELAVSVALADGAYQFVVDLCSPPCCPT
jgi:hypothetical protein